MTWEDLKIEISEIITSNGIKGITAEDHRNLLIDSIIPTIQDYVEEASLGNVLQKDTIDDLRNLSVEEIEDLTNGVYEYVQVSGYYVKGDTPDPINYYLSNTNRNDDGGSVIEVDNIKLEHNFGRSFDVAYFGAKGDGDFDNQEVFEKCLEYVRDTGASMYIGVGTFMISYGDPKDATGFDNHTARDFIQYGLEVYDNTKIEGAGMNLTTIKMFPEATLQAIDVHSTTSSYVVGSFENLNENITIKGLTIDGTKDESTNSLAEIDALSINGKNIIYEDVRVINSKGDGIDLDFSYNIHLSNIEISNCDNSGVKLAQDSVEDVVQNVRVENLVSTNCRRSIEVRGRGILFNSCDLYSREAWTIDKQRDDSIENKETQITFLNCKLKVDSLTMIALNSSPIDEDDANILLNFDSCEIEADYFINVGGTFANNSKSLYVFVTNSIFYNVENLHTNTEATNGAKLIFNLTNNIYVNSSMNQLSNISEIISQPTIINVPESEVVLDISTLINKDITVIRESDNEALTITLPEPEDNKGQVLKFKSFGSSTYFDQSYIDDDGQVIVSNTEITDKYIAIVSDGTKWVSL